MTRAPALLATWLLLCCAGAGAQTIYKCTLDGKVSYSETPCANGTVSTLAAPPAAPVDPDAATALARQKQQADTLEQQRHQREARDERSERRAGRAADAHVKKCAKLRLQKQWAEQDAKGATIENLARARGKAQRAADTLALECPK